MKRPWKGPYLIMKKKIDLIYQFQQTPRSESNVVHMRRLSLHNGQDPGN